MSELPPESERDVEQGGLKPRQPLNQRTYHTLIDRQIAAAQAEGAFDDLPGAGKPLQLEDDALVPEEDRVGYRMLKSAGFAPPWIEMQKTIRDEQSKLEAWLRRANSGWSRTGAAEQTWLRNAYRDKLTELNRLILSYNLTVPPAVGQLALLRMQDELDRLGS